MIVSEQHLDGAEIDGIAIDTIPDVQSGYHVGSSGVTRIEAFTKSGMYADIPYVRVWVGDQPLAEFCQHNIVGVFFKRAAR
jgi:hypothetical protein